RHSFQHARGRRQSHRFGDYHVNKKMSGLNHMFMSRALELAELGRGAVSPNPMVGCVIVHEGKIIGEGYHRAYGGPHAEVHPVNSVTDQQLLKNATVYVT